MSTPILILSPRTTPDSIIMRNAALLAGWDVERLHIWRLPHRLYDRELVLYGEPLFAEVIAGQCNLALIETTFDWLVHLPEQHRKRWISYTTLAEARDISRPTFIKPVDGKTFAAAVYDSGTQLSSADALPDDTPVLLAEPVTWELEFRCFILERQIVTISPYLRNGQLALSADNLWEATDEETEAATAFANRVLADPQLKIPPAIVMDIGKIQGRGWAVVECNAAWGSDLYGCNPLKVLPVLQRACCKHEVLLSADARWVL
ncbi:MAG TPA: ATP-grasp domain-containing protein, partial [Ktedonobacteraceae bacterium]